MRARTSIGFAYGLVFALSLAPACGGTVGDGNGGNGDGGVPGVTLEIAPSGATITVVNGVAATQAYTATAHLADGSTKDVTADTQFVLAQPILGTFTAATLSAGGAAAGVTLVNATYQGVAGSVPVTIALKNSRVVAPAPANSADLFAAATPDPNPGAAPGIVYPADGTMFPPNIGDFQTHWTDGTSHDLFEIAITSNVLDLRVYVSTTDPAQKWGSFLPTEWGIVGNSVRGGGVKVTVRALTIASPALVGESSPIAVGVASEDMQGGIYYWAASAQGIFRHDFGKPEDPPEAYYTPVQSAGRCVACHALSRDGTKMAITFDGGNGAATVLDVASQTPMIPPNGAIYSNFTTFDPTGIKMITTSHGVLTLRTAADGAALATVPTPGYGDHPDWSPLGDRIVYVTVDAPTGDDWHFTGGHIVVQPFDATTNTFGTPTDLVTNPGGGVNVYYPSFSPDGKWVLFNESTEDAYNDASAQLWVVPVDGSQAPIHLATPDVGAGLTNSWARWAPFEQQTVGASGDMEPIFWFTFSSQRAFGVRLPPGKPQLWMSPFFPQRAAAMQDPSAPALWLPFQDITTTNHIAQWTTQVVPIGKPAGN